MTRIQAHLNADLFCFFRHFQSHFEVLLLTFTPELGLEQRLKIRAANLSRKGYYGRMLNHHPSFGFPFRPLLFFSPGNELVWKERAWSGERRMGTEAPFFTQLGSLP